VTQWRETAQACFYCGVPADTIDHVPPQSVRPILIQFELTKWKFHEVPACHECNCLLGARQPWTVEGRKTAVKELLKRRYRQFIEMPSWDESKLADLGRGMQDFVTESQVFARLIKQRLAW
jgi:hypothetical protein